MSYVYRILSVLVVLALLLSACNLIPPPHPGTVPGRILFIGTSDTFFNLGLDYHLPLMAASGFPPIFIKAGSETRGGAPLADLWQNPQVQSRIGSGNWDVVVVEGEYAMGADVEDERSYFEHLRKFDELIRDQGGRTVVFMDWQLKPEGRYATGFPQIEEIAAVVSRAATQVDAEVAPVGLAWARALAERPALALYITDYVHPTMAGTYLTAAVFYTTLFDRSPVDLTYKPADSLPDTEALEYLRREWQMTQEECAFLQRIAWETVREYQAQQAVAQ